MFLTDAELRDLTGRQRASAQIRWLDARGWHYEVRADGKPRVVRAFVEATMGVVAPKVVEPDFAAIEG